LGKFGICAALVPHVWHRYVKFNEVDTKLKGGDILLKPEQTPFKIVQLAEGVFVSTPIEEFCIPALRSGFSGYPINPRWNGVKVHAWKTGCRMRDALSRGEMVVRTADSMLVSAADTADPEPLEVTGSSQKSGLTFSELIRHKKREWTIA
jgi:hypothetical protein